MNIYRILNLVTKKIGIRWGGKGIGENKKDIAFNGEPDMEQ